MKNNRIRLVAALLFGLSVSVSNIFAMGEEKPDPNWRAPSVPFRVLAVTSNGALLWASGTDEAIAVSPDAGAHWQLKHQTQDGNLLLNIQFANDRFGYAAGTGGLILTQRMVARAGFPTRRAPQQYCKSLSPTRSTV
jgi:hypothetical protein